MIQRIQSLYLFVAGLFYFLYWFFGLEWYERGYPIIIEFFSYIKWIDFILVIFSLFGCTKSKTIRVIKLAHGLDVKHSVHQAMLKADEYINTVSKGNMRIQIYPNQQLGSERECLELLQIGSLDMTKVSGAVMENFAPKTRVFGLPFLFESRKRVFHRKSTLCIQRTSLLYYKLYR